MVWWYFFSEYLPLILKIFDIISSMVDVGCIQLTIYHSSSAS